VFLCFLSLTMHVMSGEKEGKTELNFRFVIDCVAFCFVRCLTTHTHSDCGLSKVKNFRPVLRLKNLTYLNLEHNVIVELPMQFDKLRYCFCFLLLVLVVLFDVCVFVQ
jgi:hypothetical protein